MIGKTNLFRCQVVRISLLLSCGLLASCQHPTSLAVPLEYSPTNTLSNALTLPQGQGKLYILPIDDQRSDKDKIGENREDPSAPIPIVAGLPDVPDWVHTTMAGVLRGNGINIVSSADEADLMLSVTLTDFWVKEESSYNGQITAVVKVLDKNGTPWFTGTVSGQYEQTGKGLNAEIYRQVLSNSMYSAMSRLLNNSNFEQALVVTPAARQPAQAPH